MFCHVPVGNSTGNGKADIFMWLGSDGGTGEGLYEARGTETETFAAPTEVLSTVSTMAMVDLNHDGILDVVDIESSPPNGFPGTNPAQINIYLGQPNGTFSNPVSYMPYAGRFAVDVGSIKLTTFRRHSGRTLPTLMAMGTWI